MRSKTFGIFSIIICMDLHNDHERCIIIHCYSLHNDDHNVIIHFLTNKFVGAPYHITWGCIFLFHQWQNKQGRREGRSCIVLFNSLKVENFQNKDWKWDLLCLIILHPLFLSPSHLSKVFLHVLKAWQGYPYVTRHMQSLFVNFIPNLE